MFEIDLKRGSQRPIGGDRQSELREAALPFLPVAGLLVLLLLVLAGIGGHMTRENAVRQAKVAELEKAVVAKRQELASLSGTRGTLAALSTQDIYWSDVLRLVSEKVPDKLWLTEVKIFTSTPAKDHPNEPVRRMLQIQGGVLSAASEGNLDVIAKFLESLQADPRYRESFSEAKLESVTRAGGEDPYMLVFRMTAPFRPA